MFSLNIGNDVVFLKDIKLNHLPHILNWYNRVDNFKYATGIDSPITLNELTQKYAEVAICSNEFFVGIYSSNDENMVGILKGSMKYKNKDAVWISSIVIDTKYQKMGFGKAAIELLLNNFKKNNNVKCAYIAVIEENIQGRTFWLKQNFRELRKIKSHIKMHQKQQNVIIMCKPF